MEYLWTSLIYELKRICSALYLEHVSLGSWGTKGFLFAQWSRLPALTHVGVPATVAP